MRYMTIILAVFCVVSMVSATGTCLHAAVPDPDVVAGNLQTGKALPDFNGFIKDKWPRQTGPYVWSELKKSGGGKESQINDSDIWFRKKAYQLHLTAVATNMLHSKFRPTFEAVWQAYPSLKPEIGMAATHQGGQARPYTQGGIRFALTIEIYGFSGASANAAIGNTDFKYGIFFPKTAQAVQTASGKPIHIFEDRGGKNAWLAQGDWAASLRPLRTGDDLPIDIFRLAADGIFKAMGPGIGPAKPKADPPEPDLMELTCQAVGFQTDKEMVGAGDEPRYIELSGIVKNENNDPVQGAVVKIEAYDEWTQTDDQGAYFLGLEFVDGKGKFKIQQDFMLQTIPDSLQASITFDRDQIPRADGRSVEAQVVVTNQGTPWANKKMMFNPPKQFTVRGIPVWYIQRALPGGIRTDFMTDDKGHARILLPVPMVKKVELRQTSRENPADLLFPIQGNLVLVDGMTNKTAAMEISYASPYPRIRRLALPALWNGKWPSAKGELLLDEDQCIVELRAYGRFLVKGYESDRKRQVRMDGQKNLNFGFMPVVAGADDFTDIPDYGVEMGKALSESVIDISVNALGGELLKQYGPPKMGRQEAIDRISSAAQNKAGWAQGFTAAAGKGGMDAGHADMVAKSATAMQGRAQKLISDWGSGNNSASFGGLAAESLKAGLTLKAMAEGKRVSKGQLSAQKNAIELGSTAYGLFEAGAGVTQWGAKAIDKAGYGLSAMKLIFTAAKTTHDCYLEYQRTVLGWDDTVLMPFMALVTNGAGYSMGTIRYVPVKFEKKAD